jgi:hypothetical protein
MLGANMRSCTVSLVGTILLSLHSFAQTSDESSWGVVTSGITYVITPGGFKEPPGPGEGAGVTVSPFAFIIRGTPHSEVTVTLNLPESFISLDANGSLPLTNWTYVVPPNEGDFGCPCPIPRDSVTMYLDSSGTRILLIGATVSIPENAFEGAYSAGITVSYSGVQSTTPSIGSHEAPSKPTTDTTVERSIDVVGSPWGSTIDAEMRNLSRNRSYSLVPGTNSNPVSPLFNGRETGTIARFPIAGNSGSEILVSTVLPTHFQSDDELYPAGLPITYSDSSFYVEETGQYIDPRAEVILRIGTGGSVTLDIGLNLTVPLDAPPGGYTTQMILSVTYTGNSRSTPRVPMTSEAEVFITAQVLSEDTPEHFSLLQNYPNPFNSSTTISYGLPRSANVKLKVYNLLGQEMFTVVDGVKYAGVQSDRFDFGNLPSGIYYYRIVTEGFSETKKMVIMR